jgi:hypothetical protein
MTDGAKGVSTVSGVNVTPGTLNKRASRFVAGPIGMLTNMYLRGPRYRAERFGIEGGLVRLMIPWSVTNTRCFTCPEDLSDVRLQPSGAWF